MKRIITSIFLVILCISLISCNSIKKLNINELEKSIYEDSKKSEDVLLSVKEKDITQNTESITLIFTNLSNKEYSYGKEPHLEVKDNGVWYEVPIIEGIGWSELGYMLGANNNNELNFNIKDYYGKLSKGNYRIIKILYENGEKVVSIAEFEVND